MGQAANAFQFDPELEALAAPEEQLHQAAPDLCCVVMAETADVACSLSSLLEQAQYNAKLIQTKTVAETRETLDKSRTLEQALAEYVKHL